MQIHTGPFAGHEFLPEHAFLKQAERVGEPPYNAILMPALTQAFLEKFDPQQGWAVQIKATWLPLDMVPRAKEGEIVVAAVPCVQFDAFLIDPQGRTVSTASSVWTIKEVSSYEVGETNARRRLYEACGLQTRFGMPDDSALTLASQGIPAPVAVLRQTKPSAVEITPVEDDSNGAGGDPSTAEEPVPVEVEASVKAAAEASAAADGETGVEASQPAESAETSPAQEAATVPEAPATTVVSIGRRSKRVRLPLDAPAPQAIIDQVVRSALNKGVPVPDVSTKGKALEALRQLQG